MYDERLHFTFNDLSAFSNTNNIKLEDPELKEKKKEKGLEFDLNK